MSEDFVGIQEIVEAARRNLQQTAWNYLVGGSESETTMRRNRHALDGLALRPRVLVDVSKVDTSARFLGQNIRIPVVIAPVGGLQGFTPDGAAASARAASEFGTVQVVSSASEPGIEAVMAAAPGPKAYQLYIRGDWAWIQDMLDRIKAAGYLSICICVDNAHISRRERVILSRQQVFARPTGPRWGGMVTWDTIDKIKAYIGLPVMLKGIATAEDAALAVDHGVDIVWVSNHGGRQLDHGQGTIEMLPEVVNAVNGKATIVLDGGIVRGTDVLKAVALGADAVAIGKLQGWGLGAGGTTGLVRVLELLEEEIAVDMALLGVTSLKQLNPRFICKAEVVAPAHEMSAWVGLAGNRLL
ncbi:MAG: alpha-hydroxy acid oxidase [Chloroflexi bacterium]|nr:alpha-hydroxy acid oxidase [Chloroflexota bacterium]